MRKSELKIIYQLWGGDVWPDTWLGSTLKQCGDKMFNDTLITRYDNVLSGGDFVTRVFALRALSHSKEPGSILIAPPRHPRDCLVPWVLKEDVRNKIMSDFCWHSEDFIDGLKEILSESLARLSVKGKVSITKRVCAVHPGRPHLMALKKAADIDKEFDVWRRFEQEMSSSYRDVQSH